MLYFDILNSELEFVFLLIFSQPFAIDRCKILQPFPVPNPNLTRVTRVLLVHCRTAVVRAAGGADPLAGAVDARGRPHHGGLQAQEEGRAGALPGRHQPHVRGGQGLLEKTALSTSPGNSSHSQTNTSYSSACASSLYLIPLICFRDAPVSPISSQHTGQMPKNVGFHSMIDLVHFIRPKWG